MQKIDQGAKKLLQQLLTEISGFSHSFQLNGKPNDEVTCGGRVMSINDMSLILEDESDLVYVIIDDVVGELLILVPGLLWRELNLEKGDVVIATGLLHKLEKQCNFKSKSGRDLIIKRDDEPFRVLIKSIKKWGA